MRTLRVASTCVLRTASALRDVAQPGHLADLLVERHQREAEAEHRDDDHARAVAAARGSLPARAIRCASAHRSLAQVAADRDDQEQQHRDAERRVMPVGRAAEELARDDAARRTRRRSTTRIERRAQVGARSARRRRRSEAVIGAASSASLSRSTAHLIDRRRLERVIRRRRRQRPLERVGAFPRLGRRLLAAADALHHDVQEEQLRQRRSRTRRSTRPCSSRRTAARSRECAAACRRARGSASGRT